MKHRLFGAIAAASLVAALGLASCASLAKSFTAAAQEAGVMDKERADTINKTAAATEEISADLKKALDQITPEQEYYIGRAVGATVFQSYKAYDKKALNDYLNKLGQSLALFSERPEIFEGYHFVALDSQEINAFATPSGLIMISRGLIALTASEDELASILAHEIAHVTSRHGLKSIKNARFGQAISKTAGTAASVAGEFVGSDVKELTGTFSNSIGDITNTMIKTGYSKSAEYEADSKAVDILVAVGYDGNALQRVLAAMEKKLDPKAKDFSKTHPKPKDRINALQKRKAAPPPAQPNPAAQARFDQAMKAL